MPVDEACGRINRLDNPPEMLTTDEKGDVERAIARMNASPNARRQMEWKVALNLLEGEILGWWSSRKFDRRIRMRAFVMGADND